MGKSVVFAMKSPPPEDEFDDDAAWIPIIPEDENTSRRTSDSTGGSTTNGSGSGDTNGNGSNGIVTPRSSKVVKSILKKQSYSTSSTFCCGKSKKSIFIIGLIITYMVGIVVVAMCVAGDKQDVVMKFVEENIGNRVFVQKLLRRLYTSKHGSDHHRKFLSIDEKLKLKQQQHQAARDGLRYPASEELHLPPVSETAMKLDPKQQAWEKTLQEQPPVTKYIAEEGDIEKQTTHGYARQMEEQHRKEIEAEKSRIEKERMEEEERQRQVNDERHRRWQSNWRSVRDDEQDQLEEGESPTEDVKTKESKRKAAMAIMKEEYIKEQINRELKDGDVNKKGFASQVIAEQERLNYQNHMSPELSKEEEQKLREAREEKLRQEQLLKEEEYQRQRVEQQKRWKSDWRSTRQEEQQQHDDDEQHQHQQDNKKQNVLEEAVKHAAEIAKAFVVDDEDAREELGLQQPEREEEEVEETTKTEEVEEEVKQQLSEEPELSSTIVYDEEEAAATAEDTTSMGEQVEDVKVPEEEEIAVASEGTVDLQSEEVKDEASEDLAVDEGTSLQEDEDETKDTARSSDVDDDTLESRTESTTAASPSTTPGIQRRRGLRFWIRQDIYTQPKETRSPSDTPPTKQRRRFRWFWRNRRNDKNNDEEVSKSKAKRDRNILKGIAGLWRRMRSKSSA